MLETHYDVYFSFGNPFSICICMYHTHSDAVCFWAVILLYTLYLDVYYDSCYDVYVIWMYVSLAVL